MPKLNDEVPMIFGQYSFISRHTFDRFKLSLLYFRYVGVWLILLKYKGSQGINNFQIPIQLINELRNRHTS